MKKTPAKLDAKVELLEKKIKRLEAEKVESHNKLYEANIRNGKLRQELDEILGDISSVMKSREEAKDGS